MNFKKVIFSTLLAAGCLAASAQQEVKTEYVFNPHWYGQLQVGMQHTLGEVDFGDLNSLNVQAAVGRQFSPVWGARLTVGGLTSKAGTVLTDISGNAKETWSWNYLAPTLNATFDVTNAIWGFNPTRLVSFGVFAGAGVNYAWGNDDALAAGQRLAQSTLAKVPESGAKASDYVEHYWEDSSLGLVGQFGANLDFRCTDNLKIGVEFNTNLVNDHYNSKHAPNCDWYFNTLVGAKYAFGKTYDVRTTVLEQPEPRTEYIHDTIYVEVKVPVEVATREPLRRDIFFVIRGSQVAKSEMPKIEDIVAYLNKYPEAKVSVTGYADKGTGNPKINIGYAEKRANKVADILATQFNIPRSRMVVDSKGDTVQPYEQNNLNRVTICIAE